MRTFEHFPEDMECPICGTSEDKPCFLMPIDATHYGNICEAQPTHVDCLFSDRYRLNKDMGIIYRRVG